MCGDSTNEADVAKLMGGGRVNLYLTDPPYNVAYTGKTADALTIQNDKMDDESFRTFLHKAFKAADMVLLPGGVFYVWHADSEGFNFRGACRDVGWTVRECLIYDLGPPGLPVEARALPLRMERRRSARLVFGSLSDDCS